VCVCARACVRACGGWVGGCGSRALACFCARVALLIQYATRRQHTVWGFSGFTTFFNIISYTERFCGKKSLDLKYAFWLSTQVSCQTFLILRTNYARYCQNVKTYPLFLSDFNETWFSRQRFCNVSNIKFYQNLSSGSTVVPCGQKDGR
jgi:uncharacterized membrane protein